MEAGVNRDFASDPAWRERDLGLPLPNSPHACSVCLPTWDTIVGYEEGREKVLKRMRAGYPRFFKHPSVVRMMDNARAEVATENDEVLVLPTRLSVQRAHRWVERRAETAVRTSSFHGLQALVVPEKVKADADLYWRFTGEIVSSRQAQDLLDGTLREGSKSHLIARAMAGFTGGQTDHTFIFSSGMAAVTAVLRALPGIASGRKTLQIEFPYVDSLKVQESFGNGVAYLNEARGEAFDEALQRIRLGEFAGVFTEVPSNPLLRTVDLARLAEACTAGATPLIVDDSASGPANVDGLRFADVVTGSLTKWVSGEGDVMAGVATVRADSRFAEQLCELLAVDSAECSPLYVADAEVLLSNLKSYPKRVDAVNETGIGLAAWLADHPAVAQVWHPSLTNREEYDAVRRAKGGYGGLISFVLKNEKKTGKVYDALELSKGPSFGTPFTLVCPYTQLAHYHELEWAESCGVSRYLLRVSCGLESLETIREAFGKALESA
jgi:cystathionine gamma-synthase